MRAQWPVNLVHLVYRVVPCWKVGYLRTSMSVLLTEVMERGVTHDSHDSHRCFPAVREKALSRF